MKIAMIIHKLNVMGGVQLHVLEVARELKKLGHEVKIYTFIYAPENCFSDLLGDLDIIALKNYVPLRRAWQVFGENRAARALALKIDHDTDILNPHDQVCYKVAYYFKKRVRDIPSIWTMHDMPTKTWFFWRESQFRPGLKISLLKKAAYRLFDKLSVIKYVKTMDGILVLDRRDQKWVREVFGMDSEIIGNGLDTEKFPFSPRHSLNGRKIRLLMQGIFAVHRRFEDGILALKILLGKGYDVSLSIIGDFRSDKNYYNMILSLIRKEGLGDHVVLKGAVSEEALLTAYKESEIFLFPNHLQSWGLAVFEAMATGLPVIVSKTAGASEVLVDGKNALLIEPLWPEGAAQAIEKLVKNPSLYLQISQNGRKFAENNISWSGLADKYENCYLKKMKFKIPKASYRTVAEMGARNKMYKEHPDAWAARFHHGGSRFDGSTDTDTALKYFGQKKDANILECGPGPGAFVKILQDKGFSNIHALDFYEGLYFPDKKKLTFHEIDLNSEKMPYQDNFFDFAVSWGVYEHLENPFHFVREIHRVLKPEGVFMFSIPNIGHIMSRLIFLKRGFFPRWHEGDNHISLLPRGVFEKTFLRYFDLSETKYIKPSIDYGIFRKFSGLLPENELFGNFVVRVLKKKDFR